MENKTVAITFDDGPDYRYTPAILDILKENGVKATFFVVGTQVKREPQVLERIVKEGHAIGNHTFDHKDLTKLSKAQILKQMKDTDALIKQTVGFTPTMFRAPYGAVSSAVKQVMAEQKRQLVGWTVDTRDWAGTSPADMIAHISKETKPGGIILMHSFGSKHIAGTVEALPEIIAALKQKGYSFVTADKLV